MASRGVRLDEAANPNLQLTDTITWPGRITHKGQWVFQPDAMSDPIHRQRQVDTTHGPAN